MIFIKQKNFHTFDCHWLIIEYPVQATCTSNSPIKENNAIF